MAVAAPKGRISIRRCSQICEELWIWQDLASFDLVKELKLVLQYRGRRECHPGKATDQYRTANAYSISRPSPLLDASLSTT